MTGITDSGPLMAERVYDELFTYIVTQGLTAGDRLTIDKLTKRLNVSQTPVRQALTRLQADGLVINQRNRGFSVAPLPSRKQLCDALNIRIGVEGSYIEKAVRNSDATVLEELKASLDTMDRMIKANDVDYKEFFEADARFHIVLANAGDNTIGRDIVSDLTRRFSVFRRTYQPHWPEEVHAEHQAIYKAVVVRSSDAAKELMLVHLTNSIGRVQNAGDSS